MTQPKRERRERTDNWQLIQQWCRHPEQRLYESIRPITLYGASLYRHSPGLACPSLLAQRPRKSQPSGLSL